MGFSLGPFERKLHDRTVADLCDKLPADVVDREWETGRALSLDDGVELALSRAWGVAV